MVATYSPTRFYSLSYTDDGSLVLYNSRTGALGVVPSDQAEFARNALKRTARHDAPLHGILDDLREGGFLIPAGTDEAALVHRQYLQKYYDDFLSLIVLPTEQCNFRCVYCYESFLRGAMPEAIQEGLRRFVMSQARLKHLDVHWFGGEPLVAADIVADLVRWFFAYTREHNITFNSGMTTNGSLLTPEVADVIIPHGVRHFQITLDGQRGQHNQTRVLNGGGDTFDQVMANLRYLKSTDHTFIVMLRHNYGPESVDDIEGFVDMIKHEFGGDPRFTMYFQAIGKWGGPNDSELRVCEGQSAIQQQIRAKRLAVEAGFRGGFQLDYFQPNGSACYAANPRSFVIGSDGRVYKCTVELDYHDRNVVGHLKPDGAMELDWRKMALWVETNGRREGLKCNTCFFSPACHGAVCPKDWMDEQDCQCPSEKVGIRQMLPLLVKESVLPAPPDLAAQAQCARS